MLGAPKSDVVNGDYNRARHIFAVFTACAIFTLILAGALVTSNDAGLSVPDWPTSFGSVYKIPPMVGGVRFEHGHRMAAEFVGLLTIILAVWTWRTDARRWMRLLSITALAVVILQGILGGLTVLYFLPPAVSTAHAALGQTFFCITMIIAIFTGRTSAAAPNTKTPSFAPAPTLSWSNPSTSKGSRAKLDDSSASCNPLFECDILVRFHARARSSAG